MVVIEKKINNLIIQIFKYNSLENLIYFVKS